MSSYEVPRCRGRQCSGGLRGPDLFALPHRRAHALCRPQSRAAPSLASRCAHDKRHMVRLGAGRAWAYSLRDSIELFLEMGIPIQQVRATGGGARSIRWRQILADVFGTELVTINVTESTAYGAALLAGVGAQVYHSVEDACARTVKITGSTEPTADAAIYDAYYPRYRALYPALAGEVRPRAGTSRPPKQRSGRRHGQNV